MPRTDAIVREGRDDTEGREPYRRHRKAAKAPKAAMTPKAGKAPKAADPRRLVKREDGYVSEDGRFEVSGAATSWYLADAARPDPLGLPSISGPYRTLGEVRAAVAAAD